LLWILSNSQSQVVSHPSSSLCQNFIENVGDYITDICFLACKNQVKLEAAFINAALAVEIMEGIAASLYPELRVQQVALPLVIKAEMMHRLGLH
jgi:aarF domain-containing kinase